MTFELVNNQTWGVIFMVIKHPALSYASLPTVYVIHTLLSLTYSNDVLLNIWDKYLENQSLVLHHILCHVYVSFCWHDFLDHSHVLQEFHLLLWHNHKYLDWTLLQHDICWRKFSIMETAISTKRLLKTVCKYSPWIVW